MADQKINDGKAISNDDGTLELVAGTLDGSEGGGGLPDQSFSVHKNGTNQTGLTNGAWTKLTWSTEEYDTGATFASDKNIPNQAGKHHIDAVLRVDDLNIGDKVGIAIYKNGAAYKTLTDTMGANTYGSAVISSDILANGTTDYFEIFAYHNEGTDRTCLGNSNLTYFTGHFVEEA